MNNSNLVELMSLPRGKVIHNRDYDNTTSWLSYFFVFILLAMTGFEYFFRSKYIFFPVILFAGILYLKKGYNIDYKVVLLLMAFGTLFLLQTVVGYNKNVLTAFVFLDSLSGYYFISKIIGNKFVDTFVSFVF